MTGCPPPHPSLAGGVRRLPSPAPLTTGWQTGPPPPGFALPAGALRWRIRITPPKESR